MSKNTDSSADFDSLGVGVGFICFIATFLELLIFDSWFCVASVFTWMVVLMVKDSNLHEKQKGIVL